MQEKENLKDNKRKDQDSPKKTSREIYIERMKERMPDVDYDDEEARYNAYNTYDNDRETELEGYRTSNSKLNDLFAKDPRFASYMSDVTDGGDAAATFVRYYGKDILSKDEEEMKEIVEANQEYLNKVADAKKLEKEQKENINKSMEDMQSFKSSKQMDDDAWSAFIEKVYGVIENALLGKLDTDFLETMYRGLNYDKDVQSAAETGLIEGRNEKIDLKKKESLGDGVPDLGQSSVEHDKPVKPLKRPSFWDMK